MYRKAQARRARRGYLTSDAPRDNVTQRGCGVTTEHEEAARDGGDARGGAFCRASVGRGTVRSQAHAAAKVPFRTRHSSIYFAVVPRTTRSITALACAT